MGFFDDLFKVANTVGSAVGGSSLNPFNIAKDQVEKIQNNQASRVTARGSKGSFFDQLGDVAKQTGDFTKGIAQTGYSYSDLGAAEGLAGMTAAQLTGKPVQTPFLEGPQSSFTDTLKNEGLVGGGLHIAGNVLGAKGLAEPAAVIGKAGAKAGVDAYKANPHLSSTVGYIGGTEATGFPEAKAAGAVSPGVDNHPKFEVDDSQAKFDPSKLSVQKTTTLPAVLDHPYLFQDYPQLKGTNVRFSDSLGPRENGRFDPNTNTILLNASRSADQLKQTVLHETQHAIQTIEGHAAGGNLDVAQTIAQKKGIQPFDAYQSLAGEAEARNVGSRANMTQAQREAKPFNSTYDIAPAKQTVHFNDGQGGFFQDLAKKVDQPTLSEAPAKKIVDTYKVADDLKPVQAKLEKLVGTRQRNVRQLSSEINKLEQQGYKVSLKGLNKQTSTKNLNDKFAVIKTEAERQLVPTAPKTIDQLKLPKSLTGAKVDKIKASLKREYGDEGVLGLATDIYQGGHAALADIIGADTKTARAIADQLYGKLKVGTTEFANLGPSAKDLGGFVEQMVKLPAKELKALQKKVAVRSPKQAALLGEIAKLSDEAAGVKSTREAAIAEGKTLRRAGVESEFKPGLTKEIKHGPADVKQAFADWANARGAAELEGVKAKQPFKALDKDGLDAFHKIQEGNREGLYGKLNDYFREKYHTLKGAGVGQRYQKNYLPQLWKDDAAQVERSFGQKASENPSFTMKRVISDYRKGIELGLTPKYEKVSDLVGWYERTANRALADRQFLSSLRESGRLIEASKAPAGWKAVNPDLLPGTVYKAEPSLANAINNHLGQGNSFTQKTAQFTSRVKGAVLGAGIPGTGLNIHGTVNVLPRAIFAAKNPLTAGLKTAGWLINPKSAEHYFESNLDKAISFRKAGLTVSSEEHAFAREALAVEGNIIKRAGAKASEWQQKLFEDPLFGKVMPTLKLQYAEGLTKDLVKSGKYTEQEAMRIASKSTNEIFGGINTDELTRSKTFQQVLRTTLLAPDWLETHSSIAKGIVKGTVKLNDKQFLAYRRVARNFLLAYISANVLNKSVSGHWMFENGKGNEFSIDTNSTDDKGKKRYVNVFGGSADFIRLPYQAIEGIATGDPSAIGNIIRNRLSPPASLAVSLLSNTNPAKGNTPLFGPDQYGKPQSAGTQAANAANLVGGSVLPQQAQAFSNTLQGKSSVEQGLAQALEAPISYKTPKKSSTVKASKGSGLKKPRRTRSTRTTGSSRSRPKTSRVKVASVGRRANFKKLSRTLVG